MNILKELSTAGETDSFYKTKQGKAVDLIGKSIIWGQLNGIQTGEMLELGCGTGHWTKFFCQKGFQLTAIDETAGRNHKNIQGEIPLCIYTENIKRL